jgi:dTDP-L-rhamnose 4-epimerase
VKVLITGGMGFIGKALAERLQEAGHSVTIIDNLDSQIHGDLPNIKIQKSIKFIRMDILKIAENYKILEGYDIIYHLAAGTGTAQSMYQTMQYTKLNCLGTSAMLDALIKCKKRPKRIILASSRSVYGEGAYSSTTEKENICSVSARSLEDLDKGIWDISDNSGNNLSPVATPENFPLLPSSIYAATKAAQELILTSASDALGFELTTFRLQNVYGEGQSLQNPYTGIISIFFNKIRQGKIIPLYEDGLASRDFIHINDVIDAFINVISQDLPNRQVFNLGSGKQTTLIELASKLISISGIKTSFEITGQYRAGDIRHCFADLSLARKYLNFEPRVSLEEGLRSFVQWASNSPTYQDFSDLAENELISRGLSKK